MAQGRPLLTVVAVDDEGDPFGRSELDELAGAGANLGLVVVVPVDTASLRVE